MDSISVALMELKWYKKKLESNKLRFDILVLEIESLTYQLSYEKKKVKDLRSINLQKDYQIKLLKEQRTIDKLSNPTFMQQFGKYGLFALIGFALGVVLTI